MSKDWFNKEVLDEYQKFMGEIEALVWQIGFLPDHMKKELNNNTDGEE